MLNTQQERDNDPGRSEPFLTAGMYAARGIHGPLRRAAAIPKHRSSLIAREAGTAGLRGGSETLLNAAYCGLTDGGQSDVPVACGAGYRA
jgi:hypothetical protein